MEQKVYTVTGATGYIGRKLVERLLSEGHFVYAIIRNDSDLPSLFSGPNITPLLYDSDEGSLELAIADSDYVIHLAALYTTANDEESTKNLVQSNILMSTQIFNAANNVNPNAIIATASTFSSLDADGAYAPSTLYAATKSAVETIASFYEDLSVHFLTFPDTYGPGDWRPKIHNIVRKNESWPFQFRSSSKQQMRMLHVEDVIGHLLASLENPAKGVHIHDIYATGTLLNLKELSEILTDEECLFNEEANIVEIPMVARDISTPTGYIEMYPKIKFD